MELLFPCTVLLSDWCPERASASTCLAMLVHAWEQWIVQCIANQSYYVITSKVAQLGEYATELEIFVAAAFSPYGDSHRWQSHRPVSELPSPFSLTEKAMYIKKKWMNILSLCLVVKQVWLEGLGLMMDMIHVYIVFVWCVIYWNALNLCQYMYKSRKHLQKNIMAQSAK